jgi:hypothetical protein
MVAMRRIRELFAGVNVRRSFLVIAICAVVIGDILTGGALQRKAFTLKRYGQAAMIALVGLGVLVLVNRPGADKMGMMQTASNVVSAMPTSATTSLLQSGIGFMGGHAATLTPSPTHVNNNRFGGGSGSGSGAGAGGVTVPKRSVSDARKKVVAAGQGWTCAHCHETLEASYEVDHVVELQDGGTNDASNLMALCRNCHGRKTLDQRLSRGE